MPKYLPAAIIAALALLTTSSCGGGNTATPAITPDPTTSRPAADLAAPTVPPATPLSALDEMTPMDELPVALTADRMAISTWGYARLEVGADMQASLAFPREAQAQGDQVRLSVRPYFTARNLRIIGVERGVVDGVDVLFFRLEVSHPFPLPSDLNAPGSTAKRIDLHAFKPILAVIGEGDDNFTIGGDSVTTNAGLVVNPSGYFEPRELLDLPGALDANVFPYVHITPLDFASAITNYEPINGGWQGTDLLAPTGYGIFAQGSSHTVEVALALEPGEPISVDLAVLVEYMQPRRVVGSEKAFLPVPGDPTRLQYALPAAAGDNSAITIGFPGPLGNSLPLDDTEVIPMIASVVDWDNAAGVAADFPDFTDLSLGPEASGTLSAKAVIPGVTIGELTGAEIVGGTGFPDDPIEFEFTLENSLNNGTAGTYYGLVRIEDEQAGANVIDLSELDNNDGTYSSGNPIPGGLATVTYQTFAVVLESRVCSKVLFQLADPAGQPLQNNDQVIFLATRANGTVPPANWTIGMTYTGLLNETIGNVSGINLSAPYQSPPSLGKVQNPTRAVAALTGIPTLGNPSPLSICSDVTGTVAANAEPTCPTTVTFTDSNDQPLHMTDRIKVSWSGITDADNVVATEVSVTVQYDFDNNGSIDESFSTVAGPGGANTATSIGTVGNTTSPRVVLQLGDNALPVPAPCTYNPPAGTLCQIFSTHQILDQGGSPTLNNRDTIRVHFIIDDDGPLTCDAGSFSANMTGATDFAPVSGPGHTAIPTALSTATVVNNTRVAITNAFNIPFSITKGSITSSGCTPITGTIAANVAPSAQFASISATDSGGGTLEVGETPRAVWSSISDPDNISSEISLSIGFDFGNNGSVENTVSSTGTSGTANATIPIPAGTATMRVIITPSDIAGVGTPGNGSIINVCDGTLLGSPGNVTLATLAGTASPRSGTGGPGDVGAVTALRVTWNSVASAGGYRMKVWQWGAAQTLATATAAAPLQTLNFSSATLTTDWTIPDQTKRYLIRIFTLCSLTGADGTPSQWAMAAFCNLDGTAGNVLAGTGLLGNSEWAINWEDPANQAASIIATGGLHGNTLHITNMSGGVAGTTRWMTVSPPLISASDLAILAPFTDTAPFTPGDSRLEFLNQRSGGTYSTPGGFTVMQRATRPTNLNALASTTGGAFTSMMIRTGGAITGDTPNTAFAEFGMASTVNAYPNGIGLGVTRFDIIDQVTPDSGVFLGFAEVSPSTATHMLDDMALLLF